MTVSSYSQNTYPKKIVWNNDTIVAITPNQLTQINIKFEGYKYCNTELENSIKYIGEIERLSLQKDSVIADYKVTYRSLTMAYDNLDWLTTRIEKDNININNQNVKLKRNLKIFTGVSFVAGATLILLVK